ncbi:TonB-dependent receptor plug domain-containing protein [Flectobacillus major]|uniref:TonB-dependent receptor plug domain-containing protein n=1 Tax=Flectobacillus major TaxID=103 RepID=UPI00047AA2DA|nr:TonB-dependent receptor [Flectobacillus major]
MKKPLLSLGLFTLSITVMAQVQHTQKDTITVLSEVVITASRLPLNIMKSPVSIELLDAKAIKQSPAPSYFDAIEHIKGVQLLTSSLGFKVYNTRGFANPTNVRFVQLVDGIDNQAPHIGAPIGSALTPSDLDIDRAELIPGTASALYGMNSLNGMVNILSKSPFDFQGLEIQQKTGVNHLSDANTSAHLFSESSIRWAKAWQNKWAFKANFSYLTGYDWISDNQQNLNPNGNVSLGLTGQDNPAYDAINSYGNESSNRKTITLGGKRYSVARTGYYEKDLADFSLQNIKADFTLAYRPSSNTEIQYSYRIGGLDNLYQRTNRFRLNNYQISQHSLTFKSPSLIIKAYTTQENTGESYNIRSMAENIDRTFKSDDQWFKDFTTQFNQSIGTGKNIQEALAMARTQADAGRPQPHTAEFDALIKKLGDINNWDTGAALRVKSWMYHTEGQWNMTQNWIKSLNDNWGLSVLSGFDFRNYEVYPDGNYFINPTEAGKNLNYYKYGAFVQLEKALLNEKIQINATIRADKNQYFNWRWNPRVAVVYSPTNEHSIRISYQNGYRFPSLFEAFSNVNSGGVKRVGGLPSMSQGIFENSYFKTSIDAFQAAVTNDVNTQGISTNQAIEQNKKLLVKNDYSYIKPEQVNSFELGYKGNWFDKKLLIDIDFYYNAYQNFMAQVEVSIPKASLKNPDSLAYYLNDRTQQDRYRLWTNSKSKVYNYGASWGVRYRFFQQFVFNSNVSLANLDRKDTNDGLEEAFNTPQWILNVGIANRKLTERLGFSINLKWQDAFVWQSSLATGTVPAYTSLDTQVSYLLPLQNILIKLGGTNITNQYYYNFLAGPSVGGFYYMSISAKIGK